MRPAPGPAPLCFDPPGLPPSPAPPPAAGSEGLRTIAEGPWSFSGVSPVTELPPGGHV